MATPDDELAAKRAKALKEHNQQRYEPAGEVEFRKLWADYLKHLATLSTGSILLIATFLEKLFSQPRWKAAVIVSLLGFLASILGSTIGFGGIVVDSKKFIWSGLKDDWIAEGMHAWGTVLAWVGFCIGIAGLTLFAIRNLI